MGQMLCQVCFVGLKIQFMGLEGVGNVLLLNIVGDVVEGMLVIMLKCYDQDLVNQGIVDVLKVDKKDLFGFYVWIIYVVV